MREVHMVEYILLNADIDCRQILIRIFHEYPSPQFHKIP